MLESCLKRIEAVNPTLNAIVTLDAEARWNRRAALKASREASGKLHGLPVAIKDNRATAGMRTTHGSLIYKDHIPDTDEAGVAKLRAEGAIIFAKTNLPEFGAGANTVNRVFGATGNPFDPSKTVRGSSGGSAVALATGMVPLATGRTTAARCARPPVSAALRGFVPRSESCHRRTRLPLLSPWGVNGPMGRRCGHASAAVGPANTTRATRSRIPA